MSLEEWAKKNDTKVIVFSADGGWSNYCRGAENLIEIKDLAAGLGLFQEEAAAQKLKEIIRTESERGHLNLFETVRDALKDRCDKINFDFEATSSFYFEGEVESVELKSFDISQLENEESYTLIEYSGEILDASITVSVEYTVEISFSFDHWDSIDKEYISMGSDSVAIDELVDVEIILTFFDEDGEISLGDVEIDETGATLEIGEVEPDWRRDDQGD